MTITFASYWKCSFASLRGVSMFPVRIFSPSQRCCGFRPRGCTLAGGSGEILEHCLVSCSQPWSQEQPAYPGKKPYLGFMADHNRARAVLRGAEREPALGVQPRGVGIEGERVRTIGTN